MSFNALRKTGGSFELGPIGGPYSTVASVPESLTTLTEFVGANAGTASVPAFSNVILSSHDHSLLPPGPERDAAEEMKPEGPDLYEWTDGQLRLLNTDSGGKLLNRCGAALGYDVNFGDAVDAVSASGSKVFFTSPQSTGESGCLEPALYMRVDNKTEDISEPEGVSLAPSARGKVDYDGASADGSKVFFTTASALVPGAGLRPGYKLYEYDSDAPEGHRLTLIANEVESAVRQVLDPGVVVSEDGSSVYYGGKSTLEAQGHFVAVFGIWRYDTITGTTSFVAVPQETEDALEPWSVTSNGEFFLFPSGSKASKGIEVAGPDGLLAMESRGAGNQELYRYDAANGSVVCVSCGEGVAPARGHEHDPEAFYGYVRFPDVPPVALSMSEDGQRVFFQTSARLVSQDTNESSREEESQGRLGAGIDVYEWEHEGVEEAPGVFCEMTNGCTHLISAGEDVGPEHFLGASTSGDDVFFTSAAQLLPQATPEFTNIYDARVDGGFLPSPPNIECTSCQGVGSPTPSFGSFASGTFVGPGNPPSSASTTAVTQNATTLRPTRAEQLAKALRACRKKGSKRVRASCELRAKRTYATKRR